MSYGSRSFGAKGRHLAFALFTTAAALHAFSDARASFNKPDDSVPLALAGTLGFEGTYEPAATSAQETTASESGACAAAVIDVPGKGSQIVTAGHCRGNRATVFDEGHELFVSA